MTHPTHADIGPADPSTNDESITAVLLDALCSPQLYDIVLREGELFIKPRHHMHPQPARALEGHRLGSSGSSPSAS
jgi:hypothetical protein